MRRNKKHLPLPLGWQIWNAERMTIGTVNGRVDRATTDDKRDRHPEARYGDLALTFGTPHVEITERGAVIHVDVIGFLIILRALRDRHRRWGDVDRRLREVFRDSWKVVEMIDAAFAVLFGQAAPHGEAAYFMGGVERQIEDVQ